MIPAYLRDGGQFIALIAQSRVSEPSISALDDGGFIVTARHVFDGIFGQKVDADGTRVGSNFRVNTTDPSLQSNPSVATLGDGSYVVTWQSIDQDGALFGIIARQFQADGTAIGDEFLVNTHTAESQIDPSVTALGNGGFVVTWQSFEQDGSENGIYGQRFKANGDTKGSEFRINSHTAGNQTDPNVTPLDGGGFIVTWTSLGQDGSGKGIYGQRFRANGTKAGSEFQINTETTADQSDPVIAGLQGGGFVVVWESQRVVELDDDIFNIVGQRYDAQGRAVGPEFQVSAVDDGFQTDPAVTALADGGFIVVWEAFQSGQLFDVYGQRYDANGGRIGTEFLINDNIKETQDDPTVTALANGGYAVAWFNANHVDIEAQIFKGQLFGTSKDDSLSDDVGANWMHGRGGDDILNGLAGRDKIFGGQGNDTLMGNKGNDRLSGDSGNDNLSGGNGNDVLKGNKGDDKLFGGKGDDNLVGGAGADQLKGEIGNDRLHGGGDNDVLWGGKGADVFVYKNAANEGVDRVRDFRDGVDMIDLKDFGFADFDAINANQNGANLRLSFGSGKAIVIEDFLIADFDAGDVIL